MEVVFYDRRNKREVKSSELRPINLVEMRLVVDEKHLGYLKEYKLGTLGYKSDKCPEHCSWDMWLTESDLVFLRVEYSTREER